MKYFVLILTFGFLGFILLGTSASYSQTDSNEMNYSQFMDFCYRYNPALWDSMAIEERTLSNLCDFVGEGFGEKQWNWLNGAKLDWESFAKNASENYADKIPEFIDGGIKETLRVDSFVSGRDSFPPPMMAMISFDYEKLSQVIRYDEKFTVCIDGKLVPQDSFIECSDEYVKYNFTKEELPIIPKFVKPIPLSEHTRQQMFDWCQNSPKWAKIDKQFWDVVPTRILSTIPEFESLKGQTNSVEIHSYASEDTCPPNVWMAGTFISENGDKHKFSLYHDSDFFRYNIDEIQCKNGLVLVTKSIDSSPACVRPETKQILIERRWAKSDTANGIDFSKYTEEDVAAHLLTQNQIKYVPDKLVVSGGPVTGGDPRCGVFMDANSTTHWFHIDSISDPQEMKIFSENPHPCRVNTTSCFCNAQMELAVLTSGLSYFNPEEEEMVANTLIDYLAKENINVTPKFMIGKFNINYTDPSAIGYCGELWGYNTNDYFDGAIVNGQVADYGLAKELSPLCAISEDAKWWERK